MLCPAVSESNIPAAETFFRELLVGYSIRSVCVSETEQGFRWDLNCDVGGDLDDTKPLPRLKSGVQRLASGYAKLHTISRKTIHLPDCHLVIVQLEFTPVLSVDDLKGAVAALSIDERKKLLSA